MLFSILLTNIQAQDYFLSGKGPFDPDIPSPEAFLGYPIGSHQTRHDQIVAYFDKLSSVSDKATFYQYGKTYELRKLINLTITDPENHAKMDQLKSDHMKLIDPNQKVSDYSQMPVFVNLGYGIHGNEPSSAEAAMLTAYTLIASQNENITKYLKDAVIIIDPTINPDGRDRHTHWINMYKANPLVDDPMDVEHNEVWPGGRTNHYWFDLNRDWYLAINPESRGRLAWYHDWYPNVVTDFHEMGTNSTYFFEPMRDYSVKDPVMPRENYTKLNDTFAKYFQKYMDEIGSFYFSKEVFDDSYPGYGSAYGDRQGGLSLLFEQASSRGHIQETTTGKLTFAFTIRNQYVNSLASVEASVDNREMLRDYQQRFFDTAITESSKSSIKAYVFGDKWDETRTRAFIDKLLIHKVKVYKVAESIIKNGKTFQPDYAYIVPVKQPQYRMIRHFFETYDDYADSVYYDASAWSLVNFYNMPYAEITSNFKMGSEVSDSDNIRAVDDVV